MRGEAILVTKGTAIQSAGNTGNLSRWGADAHRAGS